MAFSTGLSRIMLILGIPTTIGTTLLPAQEGTALTCLCVKTNDKIVRVVVLLVLDGVLIMSHSITVPSCHI